MSNCKTQEERLDYLVEEFKADSDEYKDLRTPDNGDEKRRILRSLMNIRMPKEMSPEVLKVQDEYLMERAAEKGVVKLSDIPVIRDGLSIWHGDITRLSVDAIVNAANSQMLGCFVPMHTCIDALKKGITLAQLNECPELFEDDYEAFCKPGYGALLSDIRNSMSVSRAEFARMIGIKPSTYCLWEREQFIPNRDNYNVLKKALAEKGVSLDESYRTKNMAD